MALPTSEAEFREQFAEAYAHDAEKFFDRIENYHHGSYIDFNGKVGLSTMIAIEEAFDANVSAVLSSDDASTFDDDVSVRIWFGRGSDDEAETDSLDGDIVETAITMLNDDEVNDGRTEAVKALLDAAGVELEEERFYTRA